MVAVQPDLAKDALEHLVGQFSSKFDAFRELVQNSIDAGSQLIQIWTEYEPGKLNTGTTIIHVDDDGEGMNRDIIEGQLTRMFSSRKEGDLTKIGKFGIGFVSIFALEPAGVLVHTGKGGQYWEIFFHKDRSFQLKELQTPLEGTQVSLFLQSSRSRHRKYVKEIVQALERWCSHSDIEITFEDRADSEGDVRRIDSPFGVQGDFHRESQVPGTHIVAAYNDSPTYGFYNRGLALYTGVDPLVLDDRAERYGHISFKIKSRYLEHTLSRESVRKDESYETAMEMLDSLVDGPLFDELLKTTEGLAAKERTAEEDAVFERCCDYMSRETRENLQKALERPLLPAHHRRPLTPLEALSHVCDDQQEASWVYASLAPSDVTALIADRLITFRAAPKSSTGQFLLRMLEVAHKSQSSKLFSRYAFSDRRAPSRLQDPHNCFFAVHDAPASKLAERLIQQSTKLLLGLGIDLYDFRTISPDSAETVSTAAPLLERVTKNCFQLPSVHQSVQRRSFGLLIDHPYVVQLLTLAETRLQLAAQMLTQSLLLSNIVDEPLTVGLLEVALSEAPHGKY